MMGGPDAIAAPMEYDPADFRTKDADHLLGHFLNDWTVYPPSLRGALVELLIRFRLGAEVYITPVYSHEGRED